MEKEIIAENNKIIAEFMGAPKREDIIPGRPLDFLVNGYWTVPEKMQYYTSWDWLMPVVEKIEWGITEFEYAAHVDISYQETYIHIYKRGMSVPERELMIEGRGKNRNKFGNTYDAVIKFLTWYNTQSK